MNLNLKIQKRIRAHKRIRARITGTKARPRLSVFKSIQHIYAQLVNDETGKIIVSASDIELQKSKTKIGGGKAVLAKEVGKLIAEKAKKEKIDSVVFDRGGFLFHGRIKAVADGAREGGLKF